MSINNFLRKHREKIVFAGFGMGIASFVNVLPADFWFFDDFTHLVYAGVCGLGAYVFWQFYTKKAPKPKFVKTVKARDYSNKSVFTEDSDAMVANDFGNTAQQNFGRGKSRERTIFDEFNSDVPLDERE
jgi:hypothetical protein